MGKLSRLIACSLVFSISILMVTLPSRAGVIFNLVAPFDAVVAIECDGNLVDVVDLSGEIHFLASVTTNRNSLSVKIEFVPLNVTGTGLLSGANYRGVGLTTEKFNVSINGPTTDTLVNNFYIIGQKNGTRYLVHETAHITIDADGNVVVAHDNLSVACPGT